MSYVHISRCADYDEGRVEAAIRESVAALGGMESIVKPGDRVVLKPNLLRPAVVEAGITTHPAVVKAVVRLVQEAGGIPTIADSPGGPHNSAYLRLVYATTGMEHVARETGAAICHDLRVTRLPYPEGHLVKLAELLAVIAEADVLINLPKLKTHGLTTMTGAIKNLFGAIPGVTKAGYHAKLQTKEQFSQMLVDMHQACRPALTIMDGIIGMEANGPSNGKLRDVGLLLASRDGIALDVVATVLVGVEPMAVPPLAVAAQWGLTSGRVEDIVVGGVPLAEARLAMPFRLPKTVSGGQRQSRQGFVSRLVDHGWLTRQLVVNPSANDRCTACGTCVRSCPVQAITIETVSDRSGQRRRARMDLTKCIRCYCCHELCPHDAVDLKRHWLAELVVR